MSKVFVVGEHEIADCLQNAEIIIDIENSEIIHKKPMVEEVHLSEKDNALRVYHFLHRCGMPANLIGYRYLQFLLNEILMDESKLELGMSDLYKLIFDHFKPISISAIERAIRHAVEIALSRCKDEEFLSIMFVRSKKGKVTNSNFIHTAVEYFKNF